MIENRRSISLKLKSKLAATNRIYIEKEQPAILVKNKTEPKSAVHSKTKTELLTKHFDKINLLMQEEQLYQNEDLSVDDVAQRIGMSSGYISQIIKNATEKNFPTWINELRVTQVKEMLLDEEFENYTALSIGLEAGFKSKSSFYTAFKKNTGVTPAKYRKMKS